MTRLELERRQVLLYLAAIAAGLAVGLAFPAAGRLAEAVLWPVLGALLFATFCQVPFRHLRDASGDRRFLAATLAGQFLLVPLAVAALVALLPADPALRLGVLLVLLVPCTDWFISFAQLGRGDAARAIAVTPLNLVLQLALLPVYLALLADREALAVLGEADLRAAVLIVAGPLALALAFERWAEARPSRAAVRERIAWWPVPLLALVVGLIATAQARAMLDAPAAVLPAIAVFIAFLVLAAVLARMLARALRLDARGGRTLAYGLGTRNSFVVLPLALALPAGWELAAIVIVVQSLVELFGMLVYLALLPRWFPDADRPR
jgi:ACR3 family arsenite efflux pump ArsB